MTRRSADNLFTSRVGADVSESLVCGVVPRSSTPAPAVASSSKREEPEAPGYGTDEFAPSEQAAGAHPNGVTRVETGDDPATVGLMNVKSEVALAKMNVELSDQATEFAIKRNEKEQGVYGQVYFGESVGCVTVE